jgi:hypothetical protein
MKTTPPTDAVIGMQAKHQELSPRDRRRLVLMRREAGAVEILFTVSARPARANARWRPIHSATRIYRSHSALNAEQIINGGPMAGRHFAATTAILELYEQIHLEKTKE